MRARIRVYSLLRRPYYKVQLEGRYGALYGLWTDGGTDGFLQRLDGLSERCYVWLGRPYNFNGGQSGFQGVLYGTWMWFMWQGVG